MENKYYVYAYLNDDRTPYYIGKGCGSRITDCHGTTPIPEKEENRIKLCEGLANIEAFVIESILINSLGREGIDKGGILKNIRPGNFSYDEVENYFKLQDEEYKYYTSMIEESICDEEYAICDEEYESELLKLFYIQKTCPEIWNQIYSDYCEGLYEDVDQISQIETVASKVSQ